jgi:IS1 family transposase
MKVDLGYWWPFAQTAWGWTVATIGGFTALYYGPRKMFETFDWYMDRFRDYKVLEYLEGQIVRNQSIMPSGGRLQQANSKSIGEIVDATGLSEKKVRASLKRLKRKKAVTSHQLDSWKADVPHLCS